MSERYSRIWSLPQGLYSEGAPVILQAGALLRDNDTAWLVGQLKFCNISDKRIKKIRVEITCYADTEEMPDAPILMEYPASDVPRGGCFGSRTPIRIADPSVRKFAVRVIAAEYTDGSAWDGGESDWQVMEKQAPITALLTDGYTLSAYKTVFGNKADRVAQEQKDLWLCTCGGVNRKNERRCYRCNASYEELTHIDKELLHREGVYRSALRHAGSTRHRDLKTAVAELEGIRGYKDADALLAVAAPKVQKMDKKQKWIPIIVSSSIVSLLAVVTLAVLLSYFVITPRTMLREGKYQEYMEKYNKTEIVIPDGTTSIRAREFRDCKMLTAITIPDSVTSIGDGAFTNCTGLTEVNIPDSVTSIGHWAFMGCSGLKSVTVGNGVTSIGDGAFRDCAALTEIAVPDSVTEIGNNTFRNCTELTNLSIGNGVTKIGANALTGCDALATLSLPFVGANKNSSENTHFGYLFGADSYFSNKEYVPASLKTVAITGDASIADFAFANCDGLTNITLADSVAGIGANAFYYCTGLTSATLGNGIPHISASAFENCTALTSVTLGNSITSIGNSAFFNCTALTEITIPDSVTEIENSAFRNCTMLTNLSLGNGVTSIGDSAFRDCTALTQITIPDSVILIGNGAFRNCEELKSVTISKKVERIGPYAFSGCAKMMRVVFRNSNGWWYAQNETTSITYPIASADLTDNNKAVEYLTVTLCDCLWGRG